MKKIEYNIMNAPKNPSEQLGTLLDLGRKGWRLSCVVPEGNHVMLYLYRVMDESAHGDGAERAKAYLE